MKLQIGDLAPLFKVEDSDGKLIDLSVLKGSKVVLYILKNRLDVQIDNRVPFVKYLF